MQAWRRGTGTDAGGDVAASGRSPEGTARKNGWLMQMVKRRPAAGGGPDRRGKAPASAVEPGRTERGRPPLRMRAWDEEFQCAGNDFEFDGEAGEGLAVNLGVNRIVVERFTNDGVGLVEVDALGAAEIAHPECRQVAQIAEATLRSESHDFELVFEEIGVRGDLEGAAVIFGAADDGERAVEFLIADANAEVLEIVTKNFA